MKINIKSFLKASLPPFLLALLRKLLRRETEDSVTWHGNYPDWQSAVAASTGYGEAAIFERVLAAARAVRDGRALWERDSVLFHKPEFNYPLCSWLLTIAAKKKGHLHVLDFGGAFGSTYMQNRKLLSTIPDVRWSVVEQEHIVRCGVEEFANEVLHFYPSMHECATVRPVDVILFSSVLQYLPQPYTLLEEALALHPYAIVLDRTPCAEQGERITVQHVTEAIYPASYPCRFMDKLRLEQILARPKGALCSPWWQSAVDPKGFLGICALYGVL